eukprot:scaffold61763_cov18-Prasinocladus_malaysianus.AAC.1
MKIVMIIVRQASDGKATEAQDVSLQLRTPCNAAPTVSNSCKLLANMSCNIRMDYAAPASFARIATGWYDARCC